MQAKNDPLTIIDGSYGEGRGQILRMSLALLAILEKPVTIQHLRVYRNTLGLGSQHRQGLKTILHVTGAEVEAAHATGELFFKGVCDVRRSFNLREGISD